MSPPYIIWCSLFYYIAIFYATFSCIWNCNVISFFTNDILPCSACQNWRNLWEVLYFEGWWKFWSSSKYSFFPRAHSCLCVCMFILLAYWYNPLFILNFLDIIFCFYLDSDSMFPMKRFSSWRRSLRKGIMLVFVFLG